MGIKNKPTFDPYSLADFEASDALNCAFRTWRTQRWSCISVTSASILPVIFTDVFVGNRYLTLFSSAVMIPYAVAVIAPLVARNARGLSSDVKTRLGIVFDRFPLVTLMALLISSVVTAPVLMLLLVSLPAAYVGLMLGVLMASPLALAIPICVIESTGFLGSIKRSLFLIRGRWQKAFGVIIACVAVASLATACRFLGAPFSSFLFVVEPLLMSWSAVGLGALYLHLYDH